jgi:gliding motility-associated-like protein
MKKTIQLALAIWLLATSLSAQQTFLKKFNHFGVATSLAQLPNGNIVLGEMSLATHGPSNLICLSPTGTLLWSVQYSAFYNARLVDMVTADDGNIVALVLVNEDISTLAPPFTVTMVKIGQNGQKIWDLALGKTSNQDLYYDMSKTPDGGILAGFTSSTASTICTKVGANGQVLWSRAYGSAGVGRYNAIQSKPDGNILLSTQAPGIFDSYLLQLDPTGQVIWAKAIPNARISGIAFFANGDLLLSGLWNNGVAFIARADAQANIFWVKTMSLSDFGDRGAIVTPTGKIMANNYALGSLSRIIIQFDGNGELEWVRNIASNFSARGESISTADGGYAVVGSRQEGFNYATMLAKTNTEGLVEGCETGLRCVETTSLSPLPATSVTISSSTLTVDTAMEGAITPIFLSADDYCEPYELPDAAFTVPDTICQHECISPTDLHQQDAEAWDWDFGGFTPSDSDQQDPGPICAGSTGNFIFTQIISFKDCLDTFSMTINVQPAPQPDLGDDITICEATSLKLDATTALATQYVWQDQASGPIRTVTESGKYIVEASSAYCTSSDTIRVVIFKNLFPSASLNLGPDQVLCDYLTYPLEASIYGITTYTWNDGTTGSSRVVNTSGYYELTASAFGCSITDGVQIDFEECKGKLYLPNAFSPNYDGINDLFEVLGQDFQPLLLRVFDRWGDFVFESQEGNFAWDGQVRGQPGQPGIYTYLFIYQDRLDGPKKVIGGDVLLTR